MSPSRKAAKKNTAVRKTLTKARTGDCDAGAGAVSMAPAKAERCRSRAAAGRPLRLRRDRIARAGRPSAAAVSAA